MTNDDVPPPPLTPPGRYTEFLPIGEGGMGLVYWALDTKLGRPVALKVLRPPGLEGPEGVTPSAPLLLTAPSHPLPHFESLQARFLQEARITGALEHPSVLPVYELQETKGGLPYYTMRFVPGDRTLQTAIDEVSDASVAERLELLSPFLMVCDALRFAHDQGVIHRDLKPDNIALGAYGEVFVLDWGLAKIAREADAHADVAPGETPPALVSDHDLRTLPGWVGTPGHVAPEAIREGVEGLDIRSDVFQLGVILFQILTGTRPYDAATKEAYARAVLGGPPPDACELSPGVPRDLARIARAAMQGDPDARPASVEALANQIRAWQRDDREARDVAGWRHELETALASASDLTGHAQIRALDRAQPALRSILEHRPDDPEAIRSERRIQQLRTEATAASVQQARRATLRRVGLCVLLAVLILGTGVVTVLEQRRREADDARRDAVTTRVRAEDVVAFMIEDAQDPLAAVGRLDLLESVAQRAVTYYESDERPDQADTLTRLHHARALINLAEVHRVAGRSSAADAPLAKALVLLSKPGDETAVGRAATYLRAQGRARQLQLTLERGRSPDAVRGARAYLEAIDALDPVALPALSRARALSEGLALLTSAERQLGSWKTASVHADEALVAATTAAEHPGATTGDIIRRGRRALAAAALAGVAGNPDRALAQAKAELGAARAASEGPLEDARWGELIARGHLVVADMHREAARYAKGLLEATRAATTAEALETRSRGNLVWRSLAGAAHRSRGDLLERLGKIPEAAAAFEASLRRVRSLVAADDANARWRNQLITLLDRAARARRHQEGESEGVARLRREAVGHAAVLLKREPTTAHHRHLVAYTRGELARSLIARGRIEEGVEHLQQGVALARALFDENPANTEVLDLAVNLMHTHAAVLRLAGDFDGALARLDETTPLLRRGREARPQHWRPRLATMFIAWERWTCRAARDAGDVAKVDAARREAVDALRAALRGPPDDRLQRYAKKRLGELGE